MASSDGPDIAGIGIDSRRIQHGDLFVALPGDPGPRFRPSTRSDRDGHDFVAHAVENGAAAVLVHRPGDYGVPTLLVEDTLDALWDLGRAGRRRLSGPVVAVTGSSGKTTVKSFAAVGLGAFSTHGSLNNHIGVPLSLARTPRDAEGGVYEIGTNHPGEIEPLAHLAKPQVAVVLNVHPAHIEHFGTLDAIRREKTSIARGLEEGGVLIRPVDVHARYRGRTITFGMEPSADIRLTDLADGIAELRTPAGSIRCAVPGGGVHRALSVCAVAAVLTALDRPLAHLERLAGQDLPQGRGNRIEAGGVTIIDESYNANPQSMAVTLDAFAGEPVGAARNREGKHPRRRIAVLGDMLELGAEAGRYHAQLAIRCAGVDGVFCAGQWMRDLYDALQPPQRWGFAARADAAFVRHCAAALKPGDEVLVKASNGIFWANRFVAALVRELDES